MAKIRTGFVSNSSSSSFLVIKPKGKSLRNMDVEDVFKIEKNSPFYKIAQHILYLLSDKIENTYSSIKEYIDYEEYIDDEEDLPYFMQNNLGAIEDLLYKGNEMAIGELYSEEWEDSFLMQANVEYIGENFALFTEEY